MLGRAIWVRKKKATPTAAHTVHLVVCPESICRFRLLLPYGSLHESLQDLTLLVVSDPARGLNAVRERPRGPRQRGPRLARRTC